MQELLWSAAPHCKSFESPTSLYLKLILGLQTQQNECKIYFSNSPIWKRTPGSFFQTFVPGTLGTSKVAFCQVKPLVHLSVLSAMAGSDSPRFHTGSFPALPGNTMGWNSDLVPSHWITAWCCWTAMPWYFKLNSGGSPLLSVFVLGYVYDDIEGSGKCVPIANCACKLKGKVYKPGEVRKRTCNSEW